jgi:hypothetical protein
MMLRIAFITFSDKKIMKRLLLGGIFYVLKQIIKKNVQKKAPVVKLMLLICVEKIFFLSFCRCFAALQPLEPLS